MPIELTFEKKLEDQRQQAKGIELTFRNQNKPADAPSSYGKQSYTTRDLTQDEYYGPIETYMQRRFGTHVSQLP